MRIRFNWPLAAVVIVVFLGTLGSWLALVLSHVLPVESGLTLLSHAGAFASGTLVPLVTYWREKKLSVELDSDPPKNADPPRAA